MFYFIFFLAFWRPWDDIIYNPPSDDCCIVIQPREEENIIKIKKEDVFKEKRMHKNKNCEVCGDIAVGRNFGVRSCAPCRHFFARNEHNDYPFDPCDKNCDVTPFSRSHCKKCRLNKCHIVGMKRKLQADVYDSRISSISTFSPQVISREEKVPILGTMNFIN